MPRMVIIIHTISVYGRGFRDHEYSLFQEQEATAVFLVCISVINMLAFYWILDLMSVIRLDVWEAAGGNVTVAYPWNGRDQLVSTSGERFQVVGTDVLSV